MTDYTLNLADGRKVTISNAAPGLSQDQVIEFARKQMGGMVASPPETRPGVGERIEHGFVKPFLGAAQVGARMQEETPGLVPDPAARAERIQQVDRFVGESLEEWEKRIKGEGVDPFTMLGTALNPQEYVPAILGGLPGAVFTGTMAGLTEPAKNFAEEKPGQVVTGTAAGTLLGAGGKLVTTGLRKLGVWLGKEYDENAVIRAVNSVRDRFELEARRGGVSAETALRMINEANERGKPMVLADVGEQRGAVRGLAGKVARTPEGKPIAAAALEGRDREANARVTADMRRYIHSGETGFHTARALMDVRDAQARPLYAATHELQGVWNDRLAAFTENPDVRKGMALGFRLERNDALTEGRPFDPTQLGVDLDVDGNIVYLRVPNMRVLDMGKRGLDAMIAAERNEETGRLSTLGGNLSRMRRAYIDTIDAADSSGTYRAARAAWEGPSASLDALRMGQHAFEYSPEEVAEQFRELTPANQEMYRVGVADRIRERLLKAEDTGKSDVDALVRGGWMREQLRPLLRTPEEFDNFMQAVTDERVMRSARQEILGGSQTAERVVEDTGEGRSYGKIARHTFTGHWGAALREAVRPWLERADRGNPQINDHVARILFGTPRELEGRIGTMLGAPERPELVRGRLGGVDLEALGRGVEATAPLATPIGAEAWREFAR